ncbi:MAG: hypothetical protein LBH13_01545 [Cellulomonadaceae bacterium]|nr:hypothetical protein [Cellulomonadaceae bacterium]
MRVLLPGSSTFLSTTKGTGVFRKCSKRNIIASIGVCGMVMLAFVAAGIGPGETDFESIDRSSSTSQIAFTGPGVSDVPDNEAKSGEIEALVCEGPLIVTRSKLYSSDDVQPLSRKLMSGEVVDALRAIARRDAFVAPVIAEARVAGDRSEVLGTVEYVSDDSVYFGYGSRGELTSVSTFVMVDGQPEIAEYSACSTSEMTEAPDEFLHGEDIVPHPTEEG